MSKQDNGGPAFPRPYSFDAEFEAHMRSQPGMSLRDYFAARAMQAIWSNNDVLFQLTRGKAAEEIASLAYEQADSMLKAREQ